MKAYKGFLTITAFSAILVGCSTVQTTVIPRSNGAYQVISTARNSADAQQGAIEKATDICHQQHKTLAVTQNKSTYQGSGKKLAAVTDAVSQAAFMNNSKTYVPSTRTNTDYKTVVTFKCN